MDELTLGLVGAGAVVVGGVVIYNAWQAAKVRRRMPRPMPAEAAESLARQERDEAPFIEPVRQSTLAKNGPHDKHDAGGEAREPVAAAAASVAPAGAGRVEPTFGGEPPSDPSSESAPHETTAAEHGDGEANTAAAADREAAAASAATHATGTESADANPPHEAAHAADAPAAGTAPEGEPEPIEPILPAATTISAAPPALVDPRIDCIVPIKLAAPVASDKILPAAQRLRRAGNKPVHIEGKLESGNWELLQNGSRYEEVRAAAQLANRNGALNELEFSEFVSGVQQFADSFDGEPDFPDMMEVVGMARELDGFAAQCDAQLSLNVMSDGAPWSANYVQAVASQDGLLLSRDGTRFVKLDARQNPVFMLQFGDTNFLRDDLTYKGGNMITLVLDVPVADEDILPFRLMCDYAKSLSERIGARVVDDQRRTLPESTLIAIDEQLMKLYAKLDAAGIPAGAPVTRRLFSQ